MSEVWKLPAIETIMYTGKEWLFQLLEKLDQTTRSILLFTFWRCWYVHNEVVHQKPAPPVNASCRFLQSYLESLIAIKVNGDMDPRKGKMSCLLIAKPPRVCTTEPELKWDPPKRGWAKLNTDGSYDAGGSAGSGMILRDEVGGIIFSACRQLFSCRDALESELTACMEGLSLSLQRSEAPIAMEMDSLMAVSMIQGEGVDRSVYASIVNEIKYLRTLRETCITHVSRSQNKASDCLAKFARVSQRTVTWLRSGPPSVLDLVQDDCKDLLNE
ncbi:hypothetical protein VPH35_019342 [Triticum aestivum]